MSQTKDPKKEERKFTWEEVALLALVVNAVIITALQLLGFFFPDI